MLARTSPSGFCCSFLPWVAVLALACGGDPKAQPEEEGGDSSDVIDEVEIIAFNLTVRIVLPLNQSNLFDEVSQLDLIVEQEGATVGQWSMEDIARGALDRAEGLPALDGAVLSLEGYDETGALVAYGRSAEVSIDDGDDEVAIFVGRANAAGWLYNLSTGSAATAIAPDSNGGMLMFGGTDRNVSGAAVRGGATDSVRRLDLGRPEDGLVFSTVGSMPAPPSSTLDSPGRAGHTATRLGGTHDNRDLILVAGGSTDFHDTSEVTDHAFLWDPTTDTVVEGGEFAMGITMRHHNAVADAAGNVVLSGGTRQDSDNNVYRPQSDLVFFDGATLTFSIIEPDSGEVSWIHHASAAFGERGTLICGGVVFPNLSPDYMTVDACAIVSTSGAYLGQADSGIQLPQGVLHHAMVGLADGSVLVTGGATYEDGVYTVTNQAWVVAADGSWTEVGPMHLPRAMHAMTRLPDGRVLVAGGASEIDTHWWHGDNAIACAEVYNPELGDFVELSTCSPGDPDGALPEAVVMPALAVEPSRGVAVIAGGLTRTDEGATGTAVYLSSTPD